MDKIQHWLEHDPDAVVSAILDIMHDGDGLTPEHLIEAVQDMLRKFLTRKDTRPYCPTCHEVMVEARIEQDDGWIQCWLCGCKA